MKSKVWQKFRSDSNHAGTLSVLRVKQMIRSVSCGHLLLGCGCSRAELSVSQKLPLSNISFPYTCNLWFTTELFFLHAKVACGHTVINFPPMSLGTLLFPKRWALHILETGGQTFNEKAQSLVFST